MVREGIAKTARPAAESQVVKLALYAKGSPLAGAPLGTHAAIDFGGLVSSPIDEDSGGDAYSDWRRCFIDDFGSTNRRLERINIASSQCTGRGAEISGHSQVNKPRVIHHNRAASTAQGVHRITPLLLAEN